LANEVLYIAGSENLKAYLSQGTSLELDHLASDFQHLCRTQSAFDQVRLLDQNGQEVLRVNYAEGGCQRVPEDQLQNKKGRYYFDDTFALSSGQMYFSPMDLNIEHGKIELPWKPMIRVGMPIIDDKGLKRGIILVNYMAADLLDEVRYLLGGAIGVPFLLNRDGYWFIADHHDQAWGFMFEEGVSFAQMHPATWGAIQSVSMNQRMADDGIYTWRKVTPLPSFAQSSTGARAASAASTGILDRAQYVWWVGTLVPATRIQALAGEGVRNAVTLFFVLGSFVVLGGFAIASARRRSHQYLDKLRSSETRLTAITQRMGEGLVTLDEDGKVTLLNAEAERLLGWSEEELAGKDFHSLVHRPNETERSDCPILRAFDEDEVFHTEHDVFVARSGKLLPVAYTASPIAHDAAGSGIIVTFQDATTRLAEKQRLAYLAAHDALTEVFNRGEIERHLEQTLALAKRYQHPLSICLFDIDHFKQINDTYGHQVGDTVLKAFADLMMDKTRKTDRVGRYGGEEFLVILPNTPIAGAIRFGELIRSSLEAEEIFHAEDARPVKVTVSVGVAELPPKDMAVDQLMLLADQALYVAKNRGRNRVFAKSAG
jgi:diguanylate cyclase (GGDEF)-like protein/PAS domain S-box-containing protein